VLCISFAYLLVNGNVQEIDSLLAGGLTDEDEDDVLQELEQIIKVNFVCFHLFFAIICALQFALAPIAVVLLLCNKC